MSFIYIVYNIHLGRSQTGAVEGTLETESQVLKGTGAGGKDSDK